MHFACLLDITFCKVWQRVKYTMHDTLHIVLYGTNNVERFIFNLKITLINVHTKYERLFGVEPASISLPLLRM